MPRLHSSAHQLCMLHLDASWDGAALAALLASGIILVSGHDAAMAQVIDNKLWVTNGPVNAVVEAGGTIYIGGNFTQVGPATGGGVPLNDTTGEPIALPKVDGYVNAIVPDGTGGWYVGGIFTHVGGVPRSNIAHILTDNTVSPWNPNPTGGSYPGVFALRLSGNIVYPGGVFTNIGGQARNNIAALDASTGLATAWDPNAVGIQVLTLAVSGNTVYAGGYFTSIGGQMRNHIAALDASSGLATPWNPDSNNPVHALAVSGTTIYAGGDFWTIGGQTRYGIAALDASSGLATPWDPHAGGPVNVLTISGSTVYAGGYFTVIGGQPRNYIAALDAASGLSTAWNPNATGGNGGVNALAVSGSTVYAGGQFTSIGGQLRNTLGALVASSGLATSWNPNPNYIGSTPYTIYALTVSGSTVYAGGTFTSIGGQPQSGIAAIAADVYTATLLAQFLATANDAGVELRWSFSDPSIVAEVKVERAPATQGPWIAIDVDRHSESEQTVAQDLTAEFGHEYSYRLIVHLRDGSTTQFGPVSVGGARILQSTLELVGPNPTGGAVQIRYAVARYGRVRLELIDLNGRVVATLVDKDHSPGRYLAAWDGRDGNRRVASTIYFLRLTAPDRTAVRKFATIR